VSPQREASVAYANAAAPVWPGAAARPYSYREALGRLREFEGWRCLWRVVAGGALLALVPLLAIGGFVAGVYVAGDLHSLGRVVLGAIIALGPGQLLSLWIWQRRPWDRLVAERLWTYEKPDGPGDLNANIQPEDFLPASRALRRAKLCPCGGTHIPTSPPGAEGLTLKLIVGRPARWHPPDAPELHVQIRDCLRAAHIRARVGMEDIYP
jgi:hypothetical protein